MRYEADQKGKTHERIVAGAAKLFRAEGYEGSGVDAVMKSAGLTAGGFYAHFKNKDALLAEAIESIFAESQRKMSETISAPGGDQPALRWVERYLSERHRDQPGTGCAIPALAGEIPRQPKSVRTAFTRAVRSYLDEFARHMPGGSRARPDDQAIAVLAAMVGAMLLARAVDDEKLSERILRATRQKVGSSFARPRPKRNRHGEQTLKSDNNVPKQRRRRT